MLIARSLLFVPANRERMVEHATSAAADVIILDLEDSVPPSEKAAARAALMPAIERLKAAGKTVHVRINGLDSGLTEDDLVAAVVPGLDGIVMPKAEAAAQVRELDVMLRLRELRAEVRPGTVLLFPVIESALGVLRCEEIAQGSTRIAGMALGGEDYTRDLGIVRTRDGRELEYARRVLLHVCVAYGLVPLDVIYADFQDAEGFAADTEYGKSIGFKGKYLIHPGQIEAVNRIYTPVAEEVEAARKMLAAYDEATGRGEGSVQFDGKMVDAPVAARARDLIAYADAISAAT